MADLAQTATWETGIYQIEITDPVIGGSDGISNRQAKQLANRTLFLKEKTETAETNIINMNNRLTTAESSVTSQGGRLTAAETKINGMQSGTVSFVEQPKNTDSGAAATTSFVLDNRGGFSFLTVVNQTTALVTSAMAGNIILRSGNGDSVFTIDDFDNFRFGDTLTFTKFGSGVLKIIFSNSLFNPISPTLFLTEIYLYEGESIQVAKIDVNWLLVSDNNRTLEVGDVCFSHLLRKGYLELNGAIVNRSAYPRLWAYAQQVGTVTDSVWNVATNKGMFSSGNGTTTFRLPDFRDTFTRSKSASRSVGSYQDDEFKEHTHAGVPEYVYQHINQLGNQPGSRFSLLNDGYSGINGGTETRPKNIALIQMIKY